MVDRFYGYQYDTSPRKLSQQQTPYRNRYSQNNKSEASDDIKQKDVSNLKRSGSRATTATNRKSSADERKGQVSRQDFDANFENNIQHKVQKNIQSNAQNTVRNTAKNKENIKAKLKIVMFLIAGFSVLFAISYQNSLISESFNKKEQYKKEMEALSKTNQQIEVNIENSLNMNNIEQAAKDKLGMQKLGNDQKIYVSLPKQDYIAPAAEEIIIEEDLGFFQKLVKGFTKSIK